MKINKLIGYTSIPHYFRNVRLLLRLLKLMFKEKKLSIKKISDFLIAKLIYFLRLPVDPPLPSIAMMEISSLCNLSCPRCRNGKGQMSNRADLFNKTGHIKEEDKFRTIPLGSLEYGLYKKVVDELKENLIFLLLYSSGEPFMNKCLPEMAAYAAERRIATIISTNGHFFTLENCKKILEARPDLIFISVSGFGQETYAKYHQGGDIEKVKQGIINLNKLKEEMKVSTIIAVRYLIFSYNEHLFKNDKQNFLRLGADFVLPRPGQFFDIEQVNEFVPKNYIPYRVALDRKSATRTTNKPCPFLWNASVIHWDGRVLPCCELSYNPEILDLVNIEKENFSDIWHGPRYKNFRKAHLNGKRSCIEACKGCHVISSFFQA